MCGHQIYGELVNTVDMVEWLEAVSARPAPFEFYTAADLRTDEHISKQMLAYHLAENLDQASYNSAFIERSMKGARMRRTSFDACFV